MSDGGDVLGVLGWGLRKYAWVVALFVVLVGVLLPWLLGRAPTQYEAQAQVGPTDTLTFSNLDPLPRLGEPCSPTVLWPRPSDSPSTRPCPPR